MAVFETWLKSDLKKPLTVKPLPGNLFSADNQGNLIGVEVMDGGSPAVLSGDVTGYVIRADGATLPISGTLDGNRASIVLPASAYAVIGHISIVIKVGTTTVGACTSYVYQTTTDTIIDPGQVLPSIADLLAQIEAAVATIPASWAGLMADIAPTYSDAAVYPVGAYVYYNGDLYRCTTAITTAESWTAGHWTQAALGNDVTDLKSALFGGTKSLHVTDIQVGYYANNSYNSSNAFRWGYVDCSSVMGYIGTVTVDLTNISDSANIQVLNSSKTFVRSVSNWTTGTRTVTLSSPEQYLRISARTDDIGKIVVIGTIPKSISSRIDSIESNTDTFALKTDLYSNSTTRELEDIVQNAYFNSGSVATNSAYLYGFVDIKNATKIVVDQSDIVDTTIICFANANKTYILNWLVWSGAGIKTTASIPANACYLIYSCKKVDYGKQTFTIYRNGIQTQIDNTVQDSTKYDGAYAYVRTIDHKFIKGLHLDCGRKYFSVANIKLLLDQMKTSGLNTFQIYFSDNNGFRFGLDDMNVVVDGITYDISVCLGDGVSPTDGSNKWLTQADMNEIISYANGKGIEVIPAFDMPGHMGAIRLDFPAVNEAYSPLTVPGRKFMITLLTKYVDYFASKGCKFFNICGDESSLTSAQWETFMLEACKAIVQHNMTPMMYNDKVCCDGYFDPFIAVGAYVLCWARRGNMASFTTLENCGYKIMNCKGNGYYWVLGTTETTQALIDAISASNIYQMTDSSVMPTICGAMYHIWCDQADADGADDGDNVVAQTLPCIAAFGTAVNNKVPEDYKPNNNTIQTYENLESLGNGKGLILRSANGTAYKITVGNDGTISSTAM